MEINWLAIFILSGLAFFPLVALLDPELRKPS